MDFEQKLDIVIREIASVYNLSEGQAILIRQNIISRVEMYKNIHPDFANDETKIVVNGSNIGDFFINRLVTNIRSYDFDKTYNKNNTLKGAYTAKDQSLYLGNYKFIEDITRDKLQNRINNVDNETLKKATRNVFNHELGHALQTSFKGKYGNNDNRYMELVSRLSTKYPNVFRLQATDEMLTPRQEGMKVIRKDDKSKEARDFYARHAFTTHLDEIFNEDEALRVTGVDHPQFSYDMGKGFSKNVYNYQSSNYRITSYGRMMKIIMGEEKTFKAMYEDSIVAYEFFDQFKEISDKIYKGKPPMFNILYSLNEIKEKKDSSLRESQNLDLFFTACLRRKVAHDLNKPNLTQDDIDRIKSYISEFKKEMTKNPNLVTEQDKIISRIDEKVIEKEKELAANNQNSKSDNNMLNNNQTDTPLYRHPMARELNELQRRLQIAKQNNDISLCEKLYNEIKSIIENNRAEVSPEQWDAMNIEERKSFIETKIREAEILKDEDDLNYWNANLNYLNSKLQEEPQVMKYDTPSNNSDLTQNKPEDYSQQVNQETGERKDYSQQVNRESEERKDYSQQANQEKEEIKDYNYYFDKVLKATQEYDLIEQKATEQKKKQLLDEILKNAINFIGSIYNDEDFRQAMTRTTELENSGMQGDMHNIVIAEMRKKYNKLHPETKTEKQPQNDLGLSVQIGQLRSDLDKVEKEYRSMMSDRYIDDEELDILISMTNRIINSGLSLKQIATKPNDIQAIDVIVNNLRIYKNRLNTLSNDIEEIGRIIK